MARSLMLLFALPALSQERNPVGSEPRAGTSIR
jgi:hypothetical protein